VAHSPSVENHVTHLAEVFGRLQMAGITLNLDKVILMLIWLCVGCWEG